MTIRLTVNAGPNYTLGEELFESWDEALRLYRERLDYPGRYHAIRHADGNGEAEYSLCPLWGDGLELDDYALIDDYDNVATLAEVLIDGIDEQVA